MNKTSILRPRVGDLVYHLFGRPLHPELFEILANRTIRRGDFSLTAWVTRAGHVFSWASRGVFLTEVTAAIDGPVPSSRRLLHHRLHGEHTAAWGPRDGFCYQVSSQVEVLPPEQFAQFHEELLIDGTKRGLLFHFPPHSRLALAPLGLLSTESGNGCLLLTAFHTFPDEFTVVKTQSLIERG